MKAVVVNLVMLYIHLSCFLLYFSDGIWLTLIPIYEITLIIILKCAYYVIFLMGNFFFPTKAFDCGK